MQNIMFDYIGDMTFSNMFNVYLFIDKNKGFGIMVSWTQIRSYDCKIIQSWHRQVKFQRVTLY